MNAYITEYEYVLSHSIGENNGFIWLVALVLICMIVTLALLVKEKLKKPFTVEK